MVLEALGVSFSFLLEMVQRCFHDSKIMVVFSEVNQDVSVLESNMNILHDVQFEFLVV